MWRVGRTGLLATVGAGILEGAGVTRAPVKVQASAASSSGAGPADQVLIVGRSSATESCKCTGTLAVGHCPGGPCPTGYWCYEVDFCGSANTKYACMNCPGTPTCSYDC
jgi:hypothetical protein